MVKKQPKQPERTASDRNSSSAETPPLDRSGASSGKTPSAEEIERFYERLERITERGQIWALSHRGGKAALAKIHALFPDLKDVPLTEFPLNWPD